MNTIVLTTANAKTDQNNVLRLNLTSDLKLENNLISLNHCNIYYNWKNFKSEYENVMFRYEYLPTNSEHYVTIPDGSYSIEDINNFLHHDMKLNGYENSDGTYDINIYANPVYNRVTITISKDFQLIMSEGFRETIGFDWDQRVLTNTEANGKLVPHLERVDTIEIHCNLVDNRVTYDSSVLYSFSPNDSFGNLLTIKPFFLETCYCRNATFSYIEVWFTDQDGEALDVEDKISVRIGIIDR